MEQNVDLSHKSNLYPTELKSQHSNSSNNNIENAQVTYKRQKKAELVKDKPQQNATLDRIWGGLRSIDKDKLVEERTNILRKQHEYNKQTKKDQDVNVSLEKAKNSTIQKEHTRLYDEQKNTVISQNQKTKQQKNVLGNDQQNQLNDNKAHVVKNYEKMIEKESVNKQIQENEN